MAVTPDDRHSVVIAKEFPYRGGTKRWTNRYHFEGDLPGSDTAWATFTDAIVAAEKLIYNSDCTIVEATGYDSASASPTNPHGDAVFTKGYSVAGTYAPSVDVVQAPGDCAGMVRYGTPARSSKNHPVYLFNYYHGVFIPVDQKDTWAAEQVILVEAYAADWLTGFSDGAEVHERCGPHGAVATSRLVSSIMRHRDFPS